MQSPSADQPGHDDLANQDGSLAEPEVPVPVVPKCVDVYLQCTNREPDEVGCRGMVRRQTQPLSNVLFFEVDCLCHQYQLIVKGGLQQANDVLESWGCGVGYVASLSKIMLLWRDNARTIFTVWQTLFGPQAAWSSARKVLPKCIPADGGQFLSRRYRS